MKLYEIFSEKKKKKKCVLVKTLAAQGWGRVLKLPNPHRKPLCSTVLAVTQ